MNHPQLPFESADPATPDKPWQARLICCGRDDGTARFATRGEAEVFRSQYTAPSGHERAVIITGPDDHGERNVGAILTEYLEAMRPDKGMAGMVEECIALVTTLRTDLATAIHDRDAIKDGFVEVCTERDQAQRRQRITQQQLGSVRALADQIQQLANYPATAGAHPAEIIDNLRLTARQLVTALRDPLAEKKPEPVSPWTILGIDPEFTTDRDGAGA